MNGVTHEEYVASVRTNIAATAGRMLDRSLPFIAGIRTLVALLEEADVPWDDADRLNIVGVASETDALPVGAVRDLWEEDALQRLDPEIRKLELWARDRSTSACESLARRFRA
jgi:hypothetical protein